MLPDGYSKRKQSSSKLSTYTNNDDGNILCLCGEGDNLHVKFFWDLATLKLAALGGGRGGGSKSVLLPPPLFTLLLSCSLSRKIGWISYGRFLVGKEAPTCPLFFDVGGCSRGKNKDVVGWRMQRIRKREKILMCNSEIFMWWRLTHSSELFNVVYGKNPDYYRRMHLVLMWWYTCALSTRPDMRWHMSDVYFKRINLFNTL